MFGQAKDETKCQDDDDLRMPIANSKLQEAY